MKTRTHTISKTKVEEVKFIIERCAEAEVWVDICDGFARIRVDNVALDPANLLTVESPYTKPGPPRRHEVGIHAHSIPCVKIDTDEFLRIVGPLKVQAVWYKDYKQNTMRLKAALKEEVAK